MQGLVDRRVQRTVYQLVAREYVGLGYQSHADCLMEHGIHQDHVVGLKCYDRTEPGFLEQLLCQDPDTMVRSLEHERRVFQIRQPDALLGRQWVRDRQGDQKLLIGKRQIRYFIRSFSRAQGQIYLPPQDGAGLFAGVELCQRQGNVRIPFGKLVVDAAVDDSAPVGSRGQPDDGMIGVSQGPQALLHPCLLIQDLLGAGEDIPSDRSGDQLAPVTEEQMETHGILIFPQEFAESGLGDFQALGGLGQIPKLCDGH